MSLDAVMLAAQQISHSRKGDDSGRSASSFLQWISDESALQMAMLADASDQVLLLVRQHDVDVPDPAQCSSFVQGFILEGTRMWLEGHCWGVGCTRVMLRFLSKPRTYLVAGGASFNGATTIGGACADAVRERCLARMRCWFRLAMEVCHAEWPFFDVLQAFTVFNLDHQSSTLWHGQCETTSREKSWERLAQLFGYQPATLFHQYTRHLPLAEAAPDSLGNLGRWRHALSRTTRMQTSIQWCSDDLRMVLTHYASCCQITSMIKRRFSKLE